jgi:hypothetical protein
MTSGMTTTHSLMSRLQTIAFGVFLIASATAGLMGSAMLLPVPIMFVV